METDNPANAQKPLTFSRTYSALKLDASDDALYAFAEGVAALTIGRLRSFQKITTADLVAGI